MLWLYIILLWRQNMTNDDYDYEDFEDKDEKDFDYDFNEESDDEWY